MCHPALVISSYIERTYDYNNQVLHGLTALCTVELRDRACINQSSVLCATEIRIMTSGGGGAEILVYEVQ